MKEHLKLVWWHLRLAVGFLFVFFAVKVMPSTATERQHLINFAEPFQWEIERK